MAFSGESSGEGIIGDVPSKGTTVLALKNIDVYYASPSVLVGNLLNKKIGEAKKGQSFQVINTKTFPSVSGNVIWIQVFPVGDKKLCKEKPECWTFLGVQPAKNKVATQGFSIK